MSDDNASMHSDAENGGLDEDYAEDEAGVQEEAAAGSEVEEGSDAVNKEPTEGMSTLFIQHGAHREYRVPEAFVQHQAVKNLPVKDGEEIGEYVSSRAAARWAKLKYYHVTILGGKNKMSGEMELAPYVCFQPPDDVDSDDHCWARPIPKAIIEHFQPHWREEIKDKFGDDPDKYKRVKAKYAKVLKWSEDQLPGQRLVPDRLGVGKGGFVLLGTKLRSIRVAPDVVPRGTKAGSKADQKAKLVSAISKNKSGKSSADAYSETSEFTTVEAKTVLLGNVDAVKTFEMNGRLYATLF